MICVLLPSFASAQPLSTPEEYFQRGMTRLRSGEAAAAAIDFERAYEGLVASRETEHRIPARYNWALALAESGAVLVALEHLDALLNGADGELEPDTRAHVRDARTRFRGELSSLRIRVVADGPVQIDVDRAHRGSITPGAVMTLNVDPGAHRVDARRSEQHAHYEVETRPGGDHDVLLTLAPSERQSGGTDEPSGEGDDGLLIGSLIGVGAAAVVGALVAVLVYAFTTPAPLPVEPPIQTLLER